MGYFEMGVHVDKHVDIEFDTEEVLGCMDQCDILDYVVSNISTEEVLARLDEWDEVRDYVMSRLDRETMQSEVLKNCSLSALLRAIADKLDNQ